ncbi:MAG: fibronectin type III domain-containing protein [Phycisphaerales bacterium]|nr:fibronectin type III domain-containing protein [Phycisphaerales bacterium]
MSAPASLLARQIDRLEPRLMMATDPITTDNPLWTVLMTDQTITLDGVLDEAAWSAATEIRRSEAFRYDSSLVIKMLYDADGLYIGLSVTDDKLWNDGKGSDGAAQRYDVETDDGMTFYFDPNNSRDEYFQNIDRAFGVNLANPNDQYTVIKLPGQMLKLVKFIKGDGAGSATDTTPGGAIATGLDWFTKFTGTLNDNSDTDVGWVSEFFFPWAAINMFPATNGTTIGMNFDIIFDNDGGQRNLTDYRSDPDHKWDKPVFVDDHLVGVHSSYTGTLGGLRGPVNYAELMFLDPSAGSIPSSISNLTAPRITGYSADLSFTSPFAVSGATGKGDVSGYEIRYTTGNLATEADWLAATVYQNAFVPRLHGNTETLRLIGLAPSTTYKVAVRAVDAAGNLGALSNILTLTTQSTSEDTSGGLRVVPSPMGHTLTKENGQEFVMVGDHLGLTWKYARTLYTGDVWNYANNQFVNFSEDGVAYEGPADPYFDQLEAKGINTMRVYIELLNNYEGVSKPPQYGFDPAGNLWLEWREVGLNPQFNPDMRQFMLNILREADERGMYIIFSTQDTFSADEAFLTEFPWAGVKGGPVGDIDNFFQTSAVLALAEARHDQLFDWLESDDFDPYSHRMIGWEPMSEWDSFEWTLNEEGDPRPSDPNATNQNWGREDEFRRRSIWMKQLGQYIKQNDPDRLLLMSTIAMDPRGPAARLIFNDRTYDLQTPHFYTNANDEPINNPDADRSIRAAVEHANLTAYWTCNDTANRPLINGEWGMTRADWLDSGHGLPHYSSQFTRAEDEDLFRTMIWSGFASGQVGTALRIATEELNYDLTPSGTQGYLLTDAMRDSQKVFSNFIASTSLDLNLASFNFRLLNGDMSVSFATGKAVKSVKHWGVTDGSQGIIYALHDVNVTTGNVSGATLRVEGLRPDQIVDVELWSTEAGTTGPTTVLTGLFVGDGTLDIALPDFTKDYAIKFKGREAIGQTQRIASVDSGGMLVTFYLDAGMQPQARIFNPSNNTTTTQDISAIALFTGRVNDMVAFTYTDPSLATEFTDLAVTDDQGHLWLFVGNLANGSWAVRDLTAELGVPGITGDLTYYTPSWGTLHISGIDARGHSVNYYYQPGASSAWAFADLTDAIDGQPFTRGLAGFVTPWTAITGGGANGGFDDALNIAGLNDDGHIIVYYWAPGFNWASFDMTTTFSGEELTGQLGAFVTSWGAMNVVGQTSAGAIYAYWWAPALGAGNWQTVDLSATAGQGPVASAVETTFSDDGGLNMFGVEADGDVIILRWTPTVQVWTATNITEAAAGPHVRFPVAGSATGNVLQVAARESDAEGSTLALFRLNIATNTWTPETTAILPYL